MPNSFLKTLSKSDFKIASTCAKKLQYKKLGYPSNLEENEFMQMLAEGGYIIGKLATLLHPGVEIKGSTAEALEQTRQLLQEDTITLHEAAIEAGQLLVRIDILRKKGNHFELIEVKAKSFDSEDEGYSEKKEMEVYIEDVVFQALVLKAVYPEAIVDAYLLMPDKSKYTQIEGLNKWFRVIPGSPVPDRPGGFRKVEVEFVFESEADFEEKVKALQADQLLELMPLNKKVAELGEQIKHRAGLFVDILNKEFQTIQAPLTKNCKGCEYRASEPEEKDGFSECWGKLAEVSPHIFDLYHGGSIGHYKKGWYLDELIDQRKVSLYDIDPERLKNGGGEMTDRGRRQWMQINQTRTNQEWINPEMKAELDAWQYPLHFIDFETYAGAIPFHAGMRPYEILAFQWSCHTIPYPGAEPVHTEWINTEDDFPNFRFAEALMNQVGESGTPLMWATHENTVLRKILEQMEIRQYTNDRLKNWLLRITKSKEDGREGRLVDMNAFTLRHYFHPYMKGRTSIKKTLPAVWNHHPYLHEVSWFRPYYKLNEDGTVMDPYQTLKYHYANHSIEAEMMKREMEEVVKDGCAAMKAYSDMMNCGNPTKAENLRRQLLEYCKLDTMAMVIIWEHWRSKSNQ